MALFPQKAQRYARKSLNSRNIEIEEGHNVSRLDNGRVILEDGREFPFDLALLAWGIQPSNLFRESDLPAGEDGGLLLNAYLQSVAYPDMFGGGDCISFEKRPLDKVGVYAVLKIPFCTTIYWLHWKIGVCMPFNPRRPIFSFLI